MNDANDPREAFHFLFLERLLRISDPRLYVLKGGANLRFYFRSPRYSEDMDLDVLGGSVATLRKNGYRVLEDPALLRALNALGVVDLQSSDPGKAKHTRTTQRFKVRLTTENGDQLPTKVEFSRRVGHDEFTTDTIDPEIARRHGRLAFPCQHYGAASAARQKLLALANRTEVQARDAFDLYVLWLGGHIDATFEPRLDTGTLQRAQENLLSLDFAAYEGQVVEFIDAQTRAQFASESVWNDVQARVLDLLSPDADE